MLLQMALAWFSIKSEADKCRLEKTNFNYTQIKATLSVDLIDFSDILDRYKGSWGL